MTTTNIEWTDLSWNPVRGCTKISPGCKHCYAKTFAERWQGVVHKVTGKPHPYHQGFDLRLVPEKLGEPLRWRKPRRVFVNSMSDLFQEGVPDEYIRRVFETMGLARQHTYQILTKRADRMQAVCSALPRDLVQQPHIWLGVSVEDRKYGLPRIDRLRETPAGLRFLSIEPLLEDLGRLDLRSIDWVIVGGESGHGARPMQEAWVLSVLEQCDHAGIPFFFKQWGGVQKGRHGRLLRGRTYDELPPRDSSAESNLVQLRRRDPKGGDPAPKAAEKTTVVRMAGDLIGECGAREITDLAREAGWTGDDLWIASPGITSDFGGPAIRLLLTSLHDARPDKDDPSIQILRLGPSDAVWAVRSVYPSRLAEVTIMYPSEY